jgi:hypothetical protein
VGVRTRSHPFALPAWFHGLRCGVRTRPNPKQRQVLPPLPRANALNPAVISLSTATSRALSATGVDRTARYQYGSVRADWNTSTIVHADGVRDGLVRSRHRPMAWPKTDETPPYCGRRSPEFRLVSGYGVSTFTPCPSKSKSLRWCLTHQGAVRNPG